MSEFVGRTFSFIGHMIAVLFTVFFYFLGWFTVAFIGGVIIVSIIWFIVSIFNGFSMPYFSFMQTGLIIFIIINGLIDLWRASFRSTTYLR